MKSNLEAEKRNENIFKKIKNEIEYNNNIIKI